MLTRHDAHDDIDVGNFTPARNGYTEERIGTLWSGNLLRVMDDAQRVARQLQQTGR